MGKPAKLPPEQHSCRPQKGVTPTAVQRWQRLTANLPGVLFQLRLETTGQYQVLYASEGTRELCELEPDALLHIFELIPAKDTLALEQAIQTSARSLTRLEHEYRIITPSRRLKWLKIVASPTLQTDGAIEWDGTILEITQRKQAEEQLRLSEQRLRQIFQSLPVLGVQVYDRDRRVIDWNNASSKLYGYSREEAIGQQLEDLIIPPEIRAEVIESIDAWVQGGPPLPAAELSLLCKDGSRVPVYCSHFVLPNAQGEPEMYCLDVDLRDRQRAETELKRSKNLLESVINTLPGGVFFKDRDLNYLGCNQFFAQVAGKNSPAELIGKSDYELPWKRAESDGFRECDRRVIESGQAELGIVETLQHGDGKQAWSETSKAPLRDEQGNVIGMVGIFQDVTQREEAAIERQKTQELLQLVIDTLPGGVFYKDRDLNYLGCNQFFAQIAGKASPAELMGKSDYELPWKRAESDWFRECDRRVMESGQAELGIIEPQQQADGTQTWVETNKAPLRDQAGNVIGILGTFQDVTQREEAAIALRQKTAEVEATLNKLHETQELLKLVINTLPGAIFWKNRDLVYQGSNEYFAQVAGVDTSENLVGITDYEMAWKTEEADFFRECDRRVIESNTPELGIIEPQLQANGKQAWLETNKVPLQDTLGNVIGIVGMFQDVTQREEAAIFLRQKTQELQQTQELLQLVINTLPGAVWWKDQDSKFQGCNNYLAQIAGFNSPEEMIGKSDYDMPWTTNEADFFVECDRRIIQSGVAELGIIEPQRQIDGKQAWLETSKLPLRNTAGEVIGTVGVFQDVTEREEAAIALRRKTNELEQTLAELQRTQLQLVQTEKLSSLGQMVAGVAHEINNPVGFIHGNIAHAVNYVDDLLGLIELFRQEMTDPPLIIQDRIEEIDLDFLQQDFRELIQSMRVGTDRIREIVKSLRNFSRLDEAAVKAVDLHEGIDSTLTILQTRLRAQDWRPEIQVRKDYGELPRIECYAGQLNQVFMNIISNGIDALEEHDRTRSLEQMRAMPSQIQVTTRALGQAVEVQIQDNGPGMAAETCERLFDPFFTTKPVGKGTGLGLSISYQIVTETHGGNLSCVSESGAGATFIITLPLQAAAAATIQPS
ncbi:MAG: PAS domain-containing protein [Cyanobacteria bacterium P01_G01_bin.54]